MRDRPLNVRFCGDCGRMILVAMAVAGTVQLTTFLLAPGLGHGETAAPAAPAPSQGTEAHGLHGLLRPAFLWFTLCAFLGRLAMMGDRKSVV